MKIGIIDSFSAAHYIPGHRKCGRLHGHNYKVIVKIPVKYHANKITVDFHTLKRHLHNVLETLDHRDITKLGLYTAEDIALYIKHEMGKRMNTDVDVIVFETDSNFVEVD